MYKPNKSDWAVKLLGDIASIGAGDPAPQGKRYFEGGRYPFVRTQDVGRARRSRYFCDTIDKVNDTAVREHGLRLWPKGTTLIPKSGASTLLNNRVRLSEPAYVSSHLATVVPSDEVSDMFLYYVLCQLDAHRLLRNPGYPSLSISDLKSVRLSIPSQARQVSIAKILDSFDKTIEEYGYLIDKTESLKKSVALILLSEGNQKARSGEDNAQ